MWPLKTTITQMHHLREVDALEVSALKLAARISHRLAHN